MDNLSSLKMPELEQYVSKYTESDIRKNFMNYISPENYALHFEKLLFGTVITSEKNLSISFLEKGFQIYYTELKERDPKEYDYIRYTRICFAMQNHDLTDEFIQEYRDNIDWSQISRRKDISLEFFEKYKDKIIVKEMGADLGHKFIEEHFESFGENITRMELSAKLISRALREKKASVRSLAIQKKFSAKILMDNFETFSLEVMTDLYPRFLLSYEDTLKIAKFHHSKDYDDYGKYNDLILAMLRNEKLTLEQKKEIKYLSVICGYENN